MANPKPTPSSSQDRPSSISQVCIRSFEHVDKHIVDWSIPDFAELDNMTETVFNVALDTAVLKFKLQLNPRHASGKDGAIYISFFLFNLNDVDLKYNYSVSVISATADRRFTANAETRLYPPEECWGWKKFRRRDDVINGAKEMLPNGCLTLRCEVGGLMHAVVPELNRALANCWQKMDFHDMVLQCGEDSFPCHRFMLAAQSDVFYNMFSHDSKESREGKVLLSDAKPEAVAQFLRFVYTGSISDRGFKMLSQLLALADKYNVERLAAMCERRLMETLSLETACEVARIAEMFNLLILQEKVVEFFTKFPEQVAKSSGWSRFSQEKTFVDLFCRIARSARKRKA